MSTWLADTQERTIVHIDEDGEKHDLNAEGAPIHTDAEFKDFIRELHEQGAFSETVRDVLLDRIP